MKYLISSFSLFLLIIFLSACQDEPLPKLGEMKETFSFVNQDSQVVNNATVKDKIYVADFFFTSCPTICPKMKAEMLRVYQAFEGDPELLLLSHSIDPKHDTVAVLQKYAEKLGVSSKNWHLMTGDKEFTYDLARSYMISALEDPTAPGGIVHSGAFILMDKQQQIRGMFDGTNSGEVDQLIKAIKKLKNEG